MASRSDRTMTNEILKVNEDSMTPADDRRDTRPAWKRPDIEVPNSGRAALTRLRFAKRDSTEVNSWHNVPGREPRQMEFFTGTRPTGSTEEKRIAMLLVTSCRWPLLFADGSYA